MIYLKKETLVKEPLVSVIIPSYNRSDSIGETVESIMSQRCDFDIELIIGDDCSTDEKLKDTLISYQNQYPQNIVLLFQENNIGLGANWAICVKNCRGKYIANCDNDDYWHNPDKLQLQVNFMEEHPEYGVCHTDYQILNPNTGKTYFVKATDTTTKGTSLQKIFFNGGFDGCNATMLYRKSLIDEYVNLDDYIKYQFALQDWTTWIILAKHTQFHRLPVSTATYRRGHESVSNLQSYEKLTEQMNKEHLLNKYICDLFSDDFPYNEKKYQNFINSKFLTLAVMRRDFPVAKKYSKALSDGNEKSFKTIMTSYRASFWIFIFLRELKYRFKFFF